MVGPTHPSQKVTIKKTVDDWMAIFSLKGAVGSRT